MLAEARRRASTEGLTNVEFLRADAQVHAFDTATFDVAISRFGSMFFSDRPAAFANIASALRPEVAWPVGLAGHRRQRVDHGRARVDGRGA
jgi:ubiquinone/menaquinone biosynthesis C-methylase UbiE